MKSDALVEKVAQAVLYEGYILYPYRASSRKNRERFTFGRVYPRDYSVAENGAEPYIMQTQCLVRRRGKGASFGGQVRFLHAMAREVCAPGEPETVLPEMWIDGQLYQTWHEAVERELALPEHLLDAKEPLKVRFSFPPSEMTETVNDGCGVAAGVIRRRQRGVEGEIEIAAEAVDSLVTKITVRIANLTPMREKEMHNSNTVLLCTFASAHTILHAHAAEFLSLTDPPPEYALAATTCENQGTWPVLVGDECLHECDTMLSSPIILYDYPQIAPESAGPMCDGTEIDEILSLRVMTMTDTEKAEMRGVDDFARRILERTESLRRDDLMKMHGTMRDVSFPGGDFFDENKRLETAAVDGVRLKAGDRVRIRPKNRADAMDMILAGKVGVIEAIEQDAEGRVHLAVVIEEDPGRDLGMMRQPGHRFFYGLDEVEPVAKEE